MSDIKLFSLDGGIAHEIAGTAVVLERSLQILIENNLEALLGVRLLASEYSTGPKHGGRIDTLGIDENGSPVIIEYKRATNENVINQGFVLPRPSRALSSAVRWRLGEPSLIGPFSRYLGL